MPRLYTFGHGSRQLDEVVAQLEQHGVTVAIDVRSFPSSRWSPQWNGRNLRQGLGGGIKYAHMPQLGGYNPDKTWPKTRDKVWFAGIARVIEIAKLETAALFCMETDHLKCHRHSAVEPDLVLACPELEIVHLPYERAKKTAPPSKQRPLF